MQPKESDLIGAVKIKDGLFMGDVYAAQDLELLITNKITHIINCAGRELPNHWESLGVVYLTLPWQETDYQVLFEGRFDVLGQMYKFIESGIAKGESVLVHSLRGQNRSCCAIAAYCMKKYKWTLYKTLEFLQSKKPNMTIRPNFFSQLTNLENKLAHSDKGGQTYNWNEISDNPNNMDSDELLITNTFLNAKSLPFADFTNLTQREYRPNKLIWVDQAVSSEPKPSLAAVFTPKKKTQDPSATSSKTSSNIKDDEGKAYVKSILKGSDKLFYLTSPNKDKAGKDSARESKEAPTPNTLGRRIKTKLRPGSAVISTGKSQLAKSSSTPMFEKAGQDAKAPNIQGNIIHITVNNYITNNNNELQRSPKENFAKEEPKTKKNRLSQSASSKEIQTLLQKPNSLQSSVGFENNSGDLRTMFQKEENNLNLSPKGRPNSYLKDLTAITPGSTPSYKSGLSKHNEKIIRRPGQTLKGLRIDDLKLPIANRSAAIYGSNNGMIKYLSKTSTAKTVNELDVTKNPGNFLPRHRKEVQRPLTAGARSNLQDSPYYNAGNYFQGNKQPKENKVDYQVKGGSLSANREVSKLTMSAKFKNSLIGEDDHYDISHLITPINILSKAKLQP